MISVWQFIQTINNIESGRNKLTKTQYIAMRSVIDAEMAQNPGDTEMLKVLLDMLVDHPENYSEENRNKLLAKANIMAPSILAGTAIRSDVSKEMDKGCWRCGRCRCAYGTFRYRCKHCCCKLVACQVSC